MNVDLKTIPKTEKANSEEILQNIMSNIKSKKTHLNSDELLQNLGYNKEPIRDGTLNKEGKSNHEFNEVLSNFGNSATTPEALEILRNENRTFDLFRKMLLFAINEVELTGKPSSVNLYLKDISHPELLTEIEAKELLYSADPSKICLEILEYNYGELNEIAIGNLIKLRKKGYKFAIDDFSLDYEPNDLSFDNLATLLRYDIVPDYVKIDGKYLEKIFDKKYDDNHERELRIIIKFLKAKNIKIIGEWIGNTEQGYKAKSLGIQLFQGKFLDDDFELDKDKGKPEIESFKLVKKPGIKSFSLYRRNKENQDLEYDRIGMSAEIMALLKCNKESVGHIIRF